MMTAGMPFVRRRRRRRRRFFPCSIPSAHTEEHLGQGDQEAIPALSSALHPITRQARRCRSPPYNVSVLRLPARQVPRSSRAARCRGLTGLFRLALRNSFSCHAHHCCRLCSRSTARR